MDVHQQRRENLKPRIKLHLISYFVQANSLHEQLKAHPTSSLHFFTCSLFIKEQSEFLSELEVPMLEVPMLEVPMLEVPMLEVPMLEFPMLEVPMLEVPMLEVPMLEVLMLEFPMLEVPMLEVPMLEVPMLEVPMLEVPMLEFQTPCRTHITVYGTVCSVYKQPYLHLISN